MTQYIVKVLVSSLLIVTVTETSKRSSLLGGLLASLPLVSFLALIWLYLDSRDSTKVAALSQSIFWLVLPSLIFFLALPALLKMKFNFSASIALATLLMLAAYGAMILTLKRFNITF
jgi:F0F1-type ATP synthase assembly protein I